MVKLKTRHWTRTVQIRPAEDPNVTIKFIFKKIETQVDETDKRLDCSQLLQQATKAFE